MNYQTELADLRANTVNLAGGDLDFANSLLGQARTRTLSDKQMFHVRRLARVNNPVIEATEALVRTMDVSASNKSNLFSGVRALFDRNIERGAKRLAIRLEFQDGDETYKLRVSLATDRKRLHVAEPDAGIDMPGRYFGFIDANGEFHKSARTPQNDGVIKALGELDADPMATALEYGRKTGECCVCGRELTNGVSVAEGIGPICSGRLV